MADKKPQTAYDILGVPKNASAEEIRQAFKKRARELHPDSDKGDEAKFKMLNEAYERLGKGRENEEGLVMRREYDRSINSRSPEGIPGFSSSGDPLRDMANAAMSDLFKGTSNFGGFGGFEGFGFQRQQKQKDEFKLTDNDLGLLVALREANRTDKPGTWLVHKSENDKREWMPDTIYSVKRNDQGRITVFRTITDFRYESDRRSAIRFKKEDKPWEYEDKELEPTARLHEYYVCREGRKLISGAYNPPYDYDKYLDAMRSLGSRLARPADKEGKYTIPELEIINRHTTTNSTRIRMEDERPYSYSEQREVGRTIRFEKFWDEMAAASKNVEYIAPRTKEGGKPGGPEGNG